MTTRSSQTNGVPRTGAPVWNFHTISPLRLSSAYTCESRHPTYTWCPTTAGAGPGPPPLPSSHRGAAASASQRKCLPSVRMVMVRGRGVRMRMVMVVVLARGVRVRVFVLMRFVRRPERLDRPEPRVSGGELQVDRARPLAAGIHGDE